MGQIRGGLLYFYFYFFFLLGTSPSTPFRIISRNRMCHGWHGEIAKQCTPEGIRNPNGAGVGTDEGKGEIS